MTNIKLVIAYDGTDFHGFARQKNLRTVQGSLETVLGSVLRGPVEVLGSGRTDAGVHARAQVVSFRPDHGPHPDHYPYLLRRMLPHDIAPVSASVVDDKFHARFSAQAKTYRYTISRANLDDVFLRRYVWHVPQVLNLEAMYRAAAMLVGEHDFTSFCAAATPIENKRRNLFELKLVERGTYLDIYCTGNGFLQNMVRILVGTLVNVGHGRICADAMPDILAARDRRLAGKTAPAQGLTLWEVHYPLMS